MNVAELIEALKLLPPEAEVRNRYRWGDEEAITDVSLEEDGRVYL